MEKYIIVISLNAKGKLVYRITAENSEVAVQKAMHELSELQLHYLENIQIIQEIEFREIKG